MNDEELTKLAFSGVRLSAAICHNEADTVLKLLAAGCDVNKPCANGCTPLHHAARQGLYESAANLLRRGADIEATTPSGATPLMLAARCGRWRVGALLLAHGADMLRRDRHGNCALNMARGSRESPPVQHDDRWQHYHLTSRAKPAKLRAC